jgi:hypothetical protein
VKEPLEAEILLKLFPPKRFSVRIFPESVFGGIGGTTFWTMTLTTVSKNGKKLEPISPFVEHVGKTPKDVSRTVLESVFRYRQVGRKTLGKVFRKENPRKVLPGNFVSFLGNLRKAYSREKIGTRFWIWSSGKISVALFRFGYLDGNVSGRKAIRPICFSGKSPRDAAKRVLEEIFLRMGVSGLEEAELKMSSSGWRFSARKLENPGNGL